MSDSIEVISPKPETFEARGIERVSPADRRHTRMLDNFTLWLSANTVISSVAVGSLAGPLFGMAWWDAVAAIVLFNLLGVLPVAFFSTLGPLLGLRQMTISRFSFGWQAAKVLALFNVLACIGWSAVNSVVGGQIIGEATDGAIPVWLGILILAAITTPVSLWGYRLVHRFERFAWLPVGVIFAALGAIAWKDFQMPPSRPWSLAAFLSFGSAVYGFATGWSSYAADYTVNQPESTSPRRVFALTFAGIVLPCISLETLGVALTHSPWLSGKMGGDLLAAALKPYGIPGHLALFVLALSVVANNIPNDYSLGLSMQVLGRWWQSISRHVLTVVGAVIYVLLAIPAAAHFGETLTDFLLIIGYWLGPYSTVLLLDYFLFRLPAAAGERHRAYDAESWDQPQRHPSRWPAIVAMALGLAGAAAGANQALWQGPVSRLFPGSGGCDVGFELAILVTAISYLVLRRRGFEA